MNSPMHNLLERLKVFGNENSLTAKSQELRAQATHYGRKGWKATKFGFVYCDSDVRVQATNRSGKHKRKGKKVETNLDWSKLVYGE